MAHTPNLSSGGNRADTRPSVLRRQPRDRVQVKSRVGTQRIRPQAQAIDKFVQAPGGGPEASPLNGLASALSSLSTQFTPTAADERRLKTEAEAAAEREVAQGDFDELDAMVRSGELPEFSSPYHRAAFFKVWGREAGERAAEKLRSNYAQFDKDNGDFSQFVSSNLEEALQGIDRNSEDGASVQAGLLSVFNRTADALRATQTAREDENVLQVKYQGVRGLLREMDEDGGNDPELLRKSIEAMRGGDALKLLSIGKAEYDDLIIDYAEELAAEGRTDAVEAILKDTRGKIGSIAGKANKQGIRAKAAIKLAKKVRETKEAIQGIADIAGFEALAEQGIANDALIIAYQNAFPGTMSDAKAISLIGTNRRAKVEGAKTARGLDAALKGQYIPIAHLFTDKQRDEIAAGMFAQIRNSVTAAGGDEAAIFNSQLRYAALNNFTNPQWKNVMSGGFKSANILELAKGGEKLPDNVAVGIDLYNRMQAANAKMTVQHTDEASRKFYEKIRVMEQLQMSRRDAVAQYLALENTKSTLAGRLAQEKNFGELASQIKKITDNADGTMLSRLFLGTQTPANTTYIADQLQRWGQLYVEIGMGPVQALELAAARIKETHTNVNGFLVPTYGYTTPGNIEEMADTAILSYIASNPQFGLEEEDIDDYSIALVSPNNPNVWNVITKFGMIAPNAATTGTFSAAAMADKVAEEARNEINVTIAAESDERGKLIVDISRNPSRIGRQGDRARAAAAARRGEAEGTEPGLGKFLAKILLSPTGVATEILQASPDAPPTDPGAARERTTRDREDFQKKLDDARQADAEVDVTVDTGTLGERSNNPGNLRLNPSSVLFNGVTNADSGDEFLVFDTPKAGIRAAARNLRTMRSRDGLTTLATIIPVWAPAAENDVEAYISAVEQRTGIGRNEQLDVTDDDVMFAVLTAIINHELGSVPYSDSLIRKAIKAAKRG